ncbi:YkgJ family cysteine cluster protein [Ottowia sp.]|uniref:YkgJ family cysteine cluster protein n=1 Tax=Ottowia sp. TaxID=1898956 RepID=UPI0034531DDA|nr:YkgJ family cysteine cluster protein [Ottowia sp.]
MPASRAFRRYLNTPPDTWILQALALPSTSAPHTSPCTRCGACCAYSDTWPEFGEEDELDGIPEHMCDSDHGRMKCDGDRCVALVGGIGQSVRCAVYEGRPNVCREFLPGTTACNQVRRYFGLHEIAAAHVALREGA